MKALQASMPIFQKNMDISSQCKPSFAAIVTQPSVNEEVISPIRGQSSTPANISSQAPVHRHIEQKEVLKKHDGAWNVVTQKTQAGKATKYWYR